MPVNLQHLQHALNATKTEQEHFQSPCAVSGIQNHFNPTRNSESARQNAPDSVHGGEIRDIKCKTGQPTLHDCPKLFREAANVLPIEAGSLCPGVWHFHAPGYGTLVGQNPDLGWAETKKAARRLQKVSHRRASSSPGEKTLVAGLYPTLMSAPSLCCFT